MQNVFEMNSKAVVDFLEKSLINCAIKRVFKSVDKQSFAKHRYFYMNFIFRKVNNKRKNPAKINILIREQKPCYTGQGKKEWIDSEPFVRLQNKALAIHSTDMF